MAEAPAQTQQPHSIFDDVFYLGGGEADAGLEPWPAPASKASIDAMPKIKVKESGRDCSICLKEFEVDEEAREMPCKHMFHSGYIQKWLKIHGLCPVFRFLIPTETVKIEGYDGGRTILVDTEISDLEILYLVFGFC
ncbi:putative Ribosomal protein L34e superfamily protein [Hibiscus syriacus]|uniref:RING-type E3 ubiquitin transferase n=1 Tax=Hibiscus syriacus TaxID=106335 RepID=A0A6A2ZQX6_HIBSY|nr:putative Ribosomal protein L34e superfamily protein [Hibiscus syriacus]